MKKWFIGIGIAFILLAVGVSGILIAARGGVTAEEVAVPEAPVEPNPPKKLLGVSDMYYGEFAGHPVTLEEATMKYQNKMAGYNAKLAAYNDALDKESQAQSDFDSQKKSYLLYIIIVVCVLGILALISFVLAFVLGKKERVPL